MDRSDLDAPLRIMTVIWLALSAGVIMFAVVLYALLTTDSVDIDALDPSLLVIVAPILMVMMAGGMVVGLRLQGAIPRDAPPEEKIQRYQMARISAMALQEGPALAIMVLSMLAGSRNWIIGAAAVGVWTIFLARPRREDLEAILRG